MKLFGTANALVRLTVLSVAFCQQVNDPVQVTEKKTGIKFSTYGIPKEGFQKSGTFEFGMILPPQPGNEYIARVVASSKGYSGISHSTGMTKALLLVFWADKKEVKTSFQYAEDYVEPHVYKGRAKATPMSTVVNATHFEFTYRCVNCFSWTAGNETIKSDASQEVLPLGWVQSSKPPAGTKLDFHDAGFGIVPLETKLSKTDEYANYAKKYAHHQPASQMASGSAGKGSSAGKQAASSTSTPIVVVPKGAPAPAKDLGRRFAQAPGLASQPALPKISPPPKQPGLDTQPKVPVPTSSASQAKPAMMRRQTSAATLPGAATPLIDQPRVPVPTGTAATPGPVKPEVQMGTKTAVMPKPQVSMPAQNGRRMRR